MDQLHLLVDRLPLLTDRFVFPYIYRTNASLPSTPSFSHLTSRRFLSLDFSSPYLCSPSPIIPINSLTFPFHFYSIMPRGSALKKRAQTKNSGERSSSLLTSSDNVETLPLWFLQAEGNPWLSHRFSWLWLHRFGEAFWHGWTPFFVKSR